MYKNELVLVRSILVVIFSGFSCVDSDVLILSPNYLAMYAGVVFNLPNSLLNRLLSQSRTVVKPERK